MVRAALTGALDRAATRRDPCFGLDVPCECPDVPAEVLDPRQTWADPQEYDRQARRLAGRFAENFTQFAEQVSTSVREAGPVGS